MESAFYYLTKQRGLPISREKFEAQMVSPAVLCHHAESKIEVMITTLDSIHQFFTQVGRGLEETTVVKFQKNVFHRD